MRIYFQQWDYGFVHGYAVMRGAFRIGVSVRRLRGRYQAQPRRRPKDLARARKILRVAMVSGTQPRDRLTIIRRRRRG